MEHTKREIEKALKKIEIAIDKMIELQDLGFGCYDVEQVLSRLRSLEINIDVEQL